MSLIRGLGAPAKEMSFPHLLALFKDLSCLLLPTIARHCPLLPAKKMSQALVASQYGRSSRRPGRVPRAAPRQPGCTVEPTNHEPRSLLARGASRREFRGFHESRVTKHESRLLCFSSHDFPAFPAILRVPPPPGAGVRAPFTKHGFPRPCGDSKESNPKPDQQVFTNHETRITNHGFCFGAAMERHGRHIAPAPFAATPDALRARSAAANPK